MAFGKRAAGRASRFSVRPLATLATRAFTTLLALTALFDAGWSVARHPGDVNVPAELRNATVRVFGFTGQNGSFGSGTVISIKRDAQGHGGWLCVLTADHVVGHFTSWQIGFGNIANGWQYNAPIMIRGPQNADGTWVDLAMLGVRVNDLRTLPNLLLPVPDVPFANMNDVVIAGYGLTGAIDQNKPNRYVVTADPYGTYRNGQNQIDGSPNLSWQASANLGGKGYSFTSLKYSLAFQGGAWPPQSGEAHFLPGDSGGPSTQWRDRNGNGQVDAGEVRLVGVHSATWYNDVNGNRIVDAGDEIYAGYGCWDVRVGSYLDWVDQSCAAVPEPASMTALGVGLLALLARRRRRKA